MRARPVAMLVSLVVVLTGAAGCGSDGPDSTPEDETPGTGRPVVVDTDLASDDLVALALLLASPDVDVRAVTVSGTGEVRCPRGAEVARGFLAAAGHPDVPVACGRSSPLAGDVTFPEEWRDAADAAWGLDLPAIEAPEQEPAAAELLAETPRDATLLSLGPLTNLAEAFRADPGLAGRVGEVVVMGGAVDVPGNVDVGAEEPAAAEWNMYVDPAAAAEVLDSGARVVLVGLDATGQAPVTPAFVAELGNRSDSSEGDLMVTLLEGNGLVASGDAYFWDPLAAAVVVDRELVTLERARLAVETGQPDAGRTYRDPQGARVDVAVGADTEGLENLLLRAAAGEG